VRYYIHVNNADPSARPLIWQVEAGSARRMDVSDSPLGRVQAKPGKDAIATLREQYSSTNTSFHELELNPGEYYPGMARPVAGESRGRNQDRSEHLKHAWASTTGQLHALIQQLEQICRIVHPVEPNLNTFGHEIRNVLILACTEVESQWKAVLTANGARARSTHDYVKLATPMRLSEYEVELPYYPWLPAVRPFANWRSGTETPTKDLRWYDAYNNVKHDRESNFKEASLGSAFEALSGFFVMICAQYGWDFALEGDAASRAFFRLRRDPHWTFSEHYVPPYDDGELRPKLHPFPE
jgi:hypothetical protein